MSGPLPPSVYVSRLRRAFFLRVHPDRFRSHEDSVRRKQAKLMQALNDRMSWSDFLSYNYGGKTTPTSTVRLKNQTPLEYHLEHRDGSLLHQKIHLNDSVENILHSMAQALRRSGAAGLPVPPKRSEQQTNPTQHNHNPTVSAFARNTGTPSNNDTRGDDVHWSQQQQHERFTSYSNHRNVDHRFDVNTTKGRDLLTFCQSLDRRQVEDRKSSRMDANAAALMGRRLYQFQSIDGTPLHWSSASFTQLMNALIELHEEHSNKFWVDSFYPLRLVLTNDDFHEALDLYGGNLHLHPGYTPIQWLEILRRVTPEKLQTLQDNRQRLEQAHRTIQTALGVKVKKGYSCSSKAYHYFVTELAHYLSSSSSEQQQEGISPSSSTVALEPIQVTVEAADACRFRTQVTKEGHIRVGAGMSVNTILAGIAKHSTQARRRMEEEKRHREISDQQARQVQWELGLARKVYKAGTFRISHEQFQECLRRIANLGQDTKEHLKLSLSGNSLGIVASGQFCHLGDDGAVIIPHDWSMEYSQ